VNIWILRRHVHVSWGISVVCAAIVIGVIWSQHIEPGLFASVAWLLAGVVLAAVGFWRGKLYAVPFLFLAGMFIGLWRGSAVQHELTIFNNLIGYTSSMTGKVSEDPDLDDHRSMVLRLTGLTIEGRPVAGTVWASTSDGNDIKRGDIVTMQGKLSEGFGSFSAALYRAEIVRVQRSVPGDIAGQVRDAFAEKVRSVIPEPQASLGNGYLLGQRRALPPELDEALQIAGLTHIVVASGYNLTILVRFARRLFVKISKYLAALTAGSMIVGFMAITGLSPSMSRAGLVAGLSLLAWYYGRKFHSLILLPFAAAITLLINPSFGWNDLGWQLSFAAFAGVMILAPLLQAYFFGDKKPGVIRQILGETIAAWLATLPILLVVFGTISNVAIVANLLILPLVPLAMILVFLSGILAFFMPILAAIVAFPTTIILGYMTSIAHFFADLPWAQTSLEFPAWSAWVAYVLLVVLCIYMQRKTAFSLRSTSIVE
jgi:competence protein ComEC